MFATVFILLQILGIVSFAMALWFNFHQRQAKTPAIERVRAFFHLAQKKSGEYEVLNAVIVITAIISLTQHDHRLFAAMMGMAVVIGAVLIAVDGIVAAKSKIAAKFA